LGQMRRNRADPNVISYSAAPFWLKPLPSLGRWEGTLAMGCPLCSR